MADSKLSGNKAISSIKVAGFKSIASESSIDFKSLTLLAGANSSGKSSMMQPLLLLKQTLEAQFDPGPLLLDGPNAKFSSTNELFTCLLPKKDAAEFLVAVTLSDGDQVCIVFEQSSSGTLDIKKMTAESRSSPRVDLQPKMPRKQLLEAFKAILPFFQLIDPSTKPRVSVVRKRCFLNVKCQLEGTTENSSIGIEVNSSDTEQLAIQNIIHLPGLRGNPSRSYPVTAVGKSFPGTFETYTASIIAKWQADEEHKKLDSLNLDLQTIGLTTKVEAHKLNDTQVKLLIGRLPHTTENSVSDMVSIADVGFGVSQVLPAIVALHAAQPKQMVYLEQPEIHLHPRAQAAMAIVLARAVRRGVRVVVETHSSLLLLGIQTLVAEGKELSPEEVKLHWFQRSPEDGTTTITSRDLDETGAFGDWPEDFDEVMLQAQSRYMDAADARLVTH